MHKSRFGLLFGIALLACGELEMSTYPPDGYDVSGSGVAWSTDYDIVDGIGYITAIANNGSFIDLTTSADHGLVVGQWVRIAGTTDYDGEYTISNVGASDEFSVLHPTFTSSQTGTFYANKVGVDFIRVENNTPAGSPKLVSDTLIPINENIPFLISSVVQASSVAGGNTVSVGADWYDADDSYLSTSYVHNAVLSAASTWYEISGTVQSPENARGCAIFIEKANNAFYAFVDYISIATMPISFSAQQSSADSIPDSTFVDVTFGNELYDYGSIFSSPTFTAPVDGIYMISSTIPIYKATGFNGGSHASIYAAFTGSISPSTRLVDRKQLIAGETYLILKFVQHMLLTAGDTMKLRVLQDDGQTLGTTGDYFTNLSIAKVE